MITPGSNLPFTQLLIVTSHILEEPSFTKTKKYLLSHSVDKKELYRVLALKEKKGSSSYKGTGVDSLVVKNCVSV